MTSRGHELIEGSATLAARTRQTLALDPISITSPSPAAITAHSEWHSAAT
jgi:hypothetical protein